MGKLDGQRALVTGAGSGLGRAISLALAAEGAEVAVEDLDKKRAESVLAELEGRGFALEGDVADPERVREWFAEIQSRFGGLEILVNNAGFVDARDDLMERSRAIAQEVLSGQGQKTALDATTTLSDEAWGRMLAVHLNGTFYCTREALKLMTPARYGRIVSMASIGATTGIAAVPHYSAAKGGIVSLMRSVAREVIALGITANAVAPGYIDTPLLDVMDDMSRAVTIAGIPMGRLGKVEEVVPTVLLLVDPANTFMTGQVLSPNGGQVI
jgi:3-oxoacyl-[acyl-carrier protein] reductase